MCMKEKKTREIHKVGREGEENTHTYKEEGNHKNKSGEIRKVEFTSLC